MKKTAVEWLVETIDEFYGYEVSARLRNQINQAKAMEKEQIEKAYSNGRVDEQFKGTNASFYRTKAEQYYNETFKSE